MSYSNDAYSQAVTSGKYDRGKNFYSKYDNVRLFWEDALTRNYMKPAITQRIETCKKETRGIRILDLGCGSGDGFEMFLDIPASKSDLRSDTNRLIPFEEIEIYTGVDLNQDLLHQNAERWGNNPKMVFVQGDLTKGLPQVGDQPYDLYFAGYGTLSHFTREQTIQLLCDVVQHAESGSIFVGDWLGRYSYEWQDLWNADISNEQWMDYYISYIYPPEERKKAKLSPLKLRLTTNEEITRHILEPVQQRTGANINILDFCDRSIFIGRHMDTGEYNQNHKPIRQLVNSLFERTQRTPLNDLLLQYEPHETMQDENLFFQKAFDAWNHVITHCTKLCYGGDMQTKTSIENPPDIAVRTVEKFQSMVENIEYFYADDIRADVLEMQLGFLLRDLETEIQQGKGNGHGLIGIFEINK